MLDTIRLWDVSTPDKPFFEAAAYITARTATSSSGGQVRGFAVVVKKSQPQELDALELHLRAIKNVQDAGKPLLFFKAPAIGFDGTVFVISIGTVCLEKADFCLSFSLEAHSGTL